MRIMDEENLKKNSEKIDIMQFKLQCQRINCYHFDECILTKNLDSRLIDYYKPDLQFIPKQDNISMIIRCNNYYDRLTDKLKLLI